MHEFVTTREKPANGGLLRFIGQSPNSKFHALWGPNCRKSPDEYPNIPVFVRPTPETGFDLHSMDKLAVQLAKFSASVAGPVMTRFGNYGNIGFIAEILTLTPLLG